MLSLLTVNRYCLTVSYSCLFSSRSKDNKYLRQTAVLSGVPLEVSHPKYETMPGSGGFDENGDVIFSGIHRSCDSHALH